MMLGIGYRLAQMLLEVQTRFVWLLVPISGDLLDHKLVDMCLRFVKP